MAAGARVPVLWICGPAGVGKSTVSWQLYTELAGSGRHVAFADSDQLCMCYPAPAGDPGRQHVKALNAGAMIPNFREAGARCVIVNGVLGPAGLETGLLPDARVTICRLRASAGEVEQRLTARDGRRDGRTRCFGRLGTRSASWTRAASPTPGWTLRESRPATSPA